MQVVYRATPTVTQANPLYGYLRGPVELTPVAESLANELPLPVFKIEVSPDRGSNSDLPHLR